MPARADWCAPACSPARWCRSTPEAASTSIWVDGQRGSYANYRVDATNVQTFGTGVRVTNAKLSNSRGWTTVQVLGSHEGPPCDNATITGNVVTHTHPSTTGTTVRG